MKNSSKEDSQYVKKDPSIRIVLVLVVILFLWQIADYFYTNNLVKNHHDYDRSSASLDLINPQVVKHELTDTGLLLRGELEDLITTWKKNGKINDVGFYVRDLDSGYGFGVNENEKFIPASLLKIVTMMAYYKTAEIEPEILSKTLIYNGEDLNLFQDFKPKESLIKGEAYSIDELIKRSVAYSDNNASTMLLEEIDSETYEKVFTELGLEYSNSPVEKTMTPKIYANLFRVLYNSTFLNQENSQKALKILHEDNFTKGIQAGINGHIKLSNKFGERVVEENGRSFFYLHDCGIIYTKHPYVICVMTKGINLEDSLDVLANISSVVYKKMKY
jgi:beta-lactamase class A